MYFPLVSDIATTSVVMITMDSTIADAVRKMYENNHRNVIISDDTTYYILAANDLIKLKLEQFDFSKSLRDVQLTKLPTIHKDENILETLEFLQYDLEYICVLNDDNTLFGFITHTDIVSHIDPEILMENYRLGDLINMNKNIRRVDKEHLINEVLSSMVEYVYDSVIIVEDNVPIGILTTKDVMRILRKSSDLSLPVKEYMSAPVQTIHEDSSIKDAINFMNKKHFKRIVIVDDDNKLLGLVLQRELIALTYSRWAILMKEHQQELNEINMMLEKKNQKYEKMASTDALTGLYNRYKFTELFVSEYKTMTQRHNAMSLMLIDLDFFKSINDTFGHNVGDSVLIQVSNMLLRHLRNVDIIGRWGGEEFIVLLPTATLDNAETLAHKLREAIAEYEMEKDVYVTASFGITQIKEGDTLDLAVKRADDALYEAKRSGRNCVRIG